MNTLPVAPLSTEIYGDPEVHPQNESYWGNVNPIGIRACYDEGKRVAGPSGPHTYPPARPRTRLPTCPPVLAPTLLPAYSPARALAHSPARPPVV